MLFSKMNPFPQKKVLTFNKNSQDFSFSVNYAELEHLRKEDIEYVIVLFLYFLLSLVVYSHESELVFFVAKCNSKCELCN